MATRRKTIRQPTRRMIRCYYCGTESEVSGKTLSTACPGCHKAIKIEDVTVKTYMPVNDLQTCGKITITKRGRVAAKQVKSGEGVDCQGTVEGAIETEGAVELGPKSEWKGPLLVCSSLRIVEGAKINGIISVPWSRDS